MLTFEKMTIDTIIKVYRNNKDKTAKQVICYLRGDYENQPIFVEWVGNDSRGVVNQIKVDELREITDYISQMETIRKLQKKVECKNEIPFKYKKGDKFINRNAYPSPDIITIQRDGDFSFQSGISYHVMTDIGTYFDTSESDIANNFVPYVEPKKETPVFKYQSGFEFENECWKYIVKDSYVSEPPHNLKCYNLEARGKGNGYYDKDIVTAMWTEDQITDQVECWNERHQKLVVEAKPTPKYKIGDQFKYTGVNVDDFKGIIFTINNVDFNNTSIYPYTISYTDKNNNFIDYVVKDSEIEDDYKKIEQVKPLRDKNGRFKKSRKVKP